MKTPREILFERHQGAEPKLDAIRQEVLADVAGERSAAVHRTAPPNLHQARSRRPGALASIKHRLSALLWPSPWAWAGATAAWMLIFALNFSASRPSEGGVVAQKPALPASVVKMASAERRVLMNSLLDLSLSEAITPPRPPVIPRPRSERKTECLCA